MKSVAAAPAPNGNFCWSCQPDVTSYPFAFGIGGETWSNHSSGERFLVSEFRKYCGADKELVWQAVEMLNLKLNEEEVLTAEIHGHRAFSGWSMEANLRLVSGSPAGARTTTPIKI